MTLQRWTGVVISALSVFVIIVNILYFKNSDAMDHYWSIGLAVVSLGLFMTSVFVEAVVLKVIQCVLFFVVSVYAVASETDPILICIGFFFMIVGFELAICYRFFDRHPVPVILGSLFGMMLFFFILFHNIGTAAAATFGVAGCFSLLWAIRYYETRQVRRIAKEAMQRADKMAEALQERVDKDAGL
jgi:hypothetical protein